MDRRCECCDRRGEIAGVASSTLGPFSIVWCRQCINHRAEPKWAVEATIDCCNGAENVDAHVLHRITVFHNGRYLTVEMWLKAKAALEVKDGSYGGHTADCAITTMTAMKAAFQPTKPECDCGCQAALESIKK